MSGKTKEISVFVDESGSFEANEVSSRFYLICFVLHDQDVDLGAWFDYLNNWLLVNGLGEGHSIHTGPLIRREGIYRSLRREKRQAVFSRMVAFIRKADIAYHCFLIDKHFNDGESAIHDTLLQEMMRFLIKQAPSFNACDRLKVYYDNGQAQVTDILKEAFAMYSSKVEFVPDVKPESYRLFQAADLLCSIELVAVQINTTGMSASARKFFGSPREFKRNILKQLRMKSV